MKGIKNGKTHKWLIYALTTALLCAGTVTTAWATKTYEIDDDQDLLDAITAINDDTEETDNIISLQDDVEITLTAAIEIENNITFVGNGYTLTTEGAGTAKPRFQVSTSAGDVTVTLGDKDDTTNTIVFDGANAYNAGAMFFASGVGSTIVMYEGATIQNMNGDIGTAGGTAVSINDGATFHMLGGTIQNNMSNSTSGYNGAVMLDGAYFIMEGGEIINNQANYTGTLYGAGITACGSQVTITGGEISDNGLAEDCTGTLMGAGIYFSEEKASGAIGPSEAVDNPFLKIEGTASDPVEISGNIGGYGGGICVASGDATIKNALICDNKASGYGGGLYLVDAVTIENTSICDNQADSYGGAIFHVANTLTLKNTIVADNTGNAGIYLYSGTTLETDDLTQVRDNISGTRDRNIQTSSSSTVTLNYDGEEEWVEPPIGITFSISNGSAQAVPFVLNNTSSLSDDAVRAKLYEIYACDYYGEQGYYVFNYAYSGNNYLAIQQGVTVTYDTQGGTTVTTRSVPAGAEITLPDTEKEGYVFLGWTVEGDDTLYHEWTVDTSITMTAQWADAVVSNSLSPDEAYDTPQIFELTYPDEDATIYFKLDDGITVEYDPDKLYYISENCTLTAWAEDDEYAKVSWTYTVNNPLTVDLSEFGADEAVIVGNEDSIPSSFDIIKVDEMTDEEYEDLLAQCPDGYEPVATFHLYALVNGEVAYDAVFSKTMNITLDEDLEEATSYQLMHLQYDGDFEFFTETDGTLEVDTQSNTISFAFDLSNLSPFMLVAQADEDSNMDNNDDNDDDDGPRTPASAYEITVEGTKNGDTQTDKDSAKAYALVTITADPDAGFAVDAVIVTDAHGNELTVTDNGDGTYSFRMPTGEVTVEVAYTEGDAVEEIIGSPFLDLSTTDDAFEAIVALYNNGIIYGMTDTTFGGDLPINRAMITTMLHRIEGLPNAPSANFPDVADEQWYTDGINWATNENIVSGYEDGLFRPLQTITNQEMCVILMHFALANGAQIDQTATVDGIADWASSAVAWAMELGMYDGNATDKITRAQACQMIYTTLAYLVNL